MHGAGIYKQRYGIQSDLRMRFVREVADLAQQFVAEQEGSYEARLADLGIGEEEAWRAYKLLQVWDRLSLYACLSDLEKGADSSIGPVPWDGGETTLELAPRGPGRVAFDPYPFGSPAMEFTFEHRLVEKRQWQSGEEFRVDFFAAPVGSAMLTMEPA
jgi:Protein of unknown function (DUF3891)